MNEMIAHLNTLIPQLKYLPGSMGNRRGLDIKHSPMATCWMEAGETDVDTESLSSYFPMEPDIKHHTQMGQEMEDGIR